MRREHTLSRGKVTNFASLLVAEDEVNPMVQILWDILRFQSFPVFTNKFPCTALCPWWQQHIIYLYINPAPQFPGFFETFIAQFEILWVWNIKHKTGILGLCTNGIFFRWIFRRIFWIFFWAFFCRKYLPCLLTVWLQNQSQIDFPEIQADRRTQE